MIDLVNITYVEGPSNSTRVEMIRLDPTGTHLLHPTCSFSLEVVAPHDPSITGSLPATATNAPSVK